MNDILVDRIREVERIPVLVPVDGTVPRDIVRRSTVVLLDQGCVAEPIRARLAGDRAVTQSRAGRRVNSEMTAAGVLLRRWPDVYGLYRILRIPEGVPLLPLPYLPKPKWIRSPFTVVQSVLYRPGSLGSQSLTHGDVLFPVP